MSNNLLIPAIRQYCHNNGKGHVVGYDQEVTNEIVSILERKLKNAMDLINTTVRSKWISVEDEFPEDGDTVCSSCSINVLVWTNFCYASDDANIGWWCYGKESKKVWNTEDGLDEGENVTHWMHLPSEPSK